MTQRGRAGRQTPPRTCCRYADGSRRTTPPRCAPCPGADRGVVQGMARFPCAARTLRIACAGIRDFRENGIQALPRHLSRRRPEVLVYLIADGRRDLQTCVASPSRAVYGLKVPARHHRHHDAARVRRRAVFVEVEPLPGSQHQLPLCHRKLRLFEVSATAHAPPCRPALRCRGRRPDRRRARGATGVIRSRRTSRRRSRRG